MRIWVVGGTSGIGRACETLLNNAGHRALASGRKTDVRSVKLLRDYASENGPFDGLVYSAGVNYLDWSDKLDCEEAADVYNINVLGLVRTLQVLWDDPESVLKRVVVIGSDAAWRPMRTSLAYNASKAALHAAVQCIAREHGGEAFSINVVAPGLIHDTDMTAEVVARTEKVRGWVSDATWEYMIGGIPMGRPGDAIEVAMIVRDVIESPPYLNGAIIPVNGAR